MHKCNLINFTSSVFLLDFRINYWIQPTKFIGFTLILRIFLYEQTCMFLPTNPNPYVYVFRMKRRNGVVFRQISRQQWWLPMISKWKLSRSCAHSGGSCRRSRIAVQSYLQTLRAYRESGTIFTMIHFFTTHYTRPPPLAPFVKRQSAVPFALNI